MTHYHLRELATASDLIGIRFKTENFGLLSKIPLKETKNLRIELSEIFPTKALTALDRLADLEKTTDKIDYLENFIVASSKQDFPPQDPMASSVAQNIRTSLGMINVGDLAKSYQISLRQLEVSFF